MADNGSCNLGITLILLAFNTKTPQSIDVKRLETGPGFHDS